MKTKCDLTRENNIKQRGAALVTVLFISLLLLTASAAMLTAVGANSRHTTDVLSETKAYYAAESGLQATINILRNRVEGDGTSVTYSEAALDPDLSEWLPYNWPTSGTATRVVVGQTAASYTNATGTSYSINVTDPDSSAVSTTFTTVGSFVQTNGSLGATRVFGTSPDTTTVSFNGVTTTLNHPAQSQSLGSFVITQAGAGAPITSFRFSIDYLMSAPRTGAVSIRGAFDPAAAGASTFTARFDTPLYPQLGSPFRLCSAGGATSTCTVATSVTTSPGVPVPVYAYIAPMEPYRLKVTATGYGFGAVKTLEGIVRRNLFNGLGSGAGTTMIGPPCPVGQTCFAPGRSNGVTYNGCAAAVPPDPPVCIPSFGTTDPTNLAYIQANPPGGGAGNMTPPPALLNPNALPSWQQSPAALDALVDQLRTAAQNSGGYHYFPSGGNLTSLGSFSTGRGITFCEGSCSANTDGGGILVVTGKLTNTGNFSFKGMIIVTGEEGWLRNGGGNGQIIGNVVIAPYNRMNYVPENHSSTFLPPRYQITGGGGSDIIFGDVNASFDTTMGITDFVAGVAEK